MDFFSRSEFSRNIRTYNLSVTCNMNRSLSQAHRDVLATVEGLNRSQQETYKVMCKVRLARLWSSSSRISSPVSVVCRYPAGVLNSVRSMQIPRRCPNQCQEYADTLQVSRPVSGVCRYSAGVLTSVRSMQIPCRCPEQCQEYADALQMSGRRC